MLIMIILVSSKQNRLTNGLTTKEKMKNEINYAGLFGSKIGAVAVGWIVLIGVLIFGISIVMTIMSWRNAEVMQRNLITAKQKDNTQEFDNMRKKINGIVSIPDAMFSNLREIFDSHASSRTGTGKDGSLMKWVQESIPNVDESSKIYGQIMNIVVSSRDGWTSRQKELLDMKRVHDNILDVGFRGLFLSSVLGRQKIDVTIITSSKTKEVFATGEDNDDGSLFQTKTNSEKE